MTHSSVSYRRFRQHPIPGVCSVFLALLPVVLAGCPAVQYEADVRSITHDGIERTYRIHVPFSYTGQKAVPLLVALHGASSSSEVMEKFSRLDGIAERETFIAVYPDGVDHQWNDGRGMSFGQEDFTGVDDVGFIAALIEGLSSEYSIDADRVYVVGSSNGGMMAHRLACEMTDRFAAFAAVIGALPENVARGVKPSRPIPALFINGTADPVVPWEGGNILALPSLGRILSVEDTARFWADHNGCTPVGLRSWEPDRDPNDGTEVWKRWYGNGLSGTEVILYGIQGGGHAWPGHVTPTIVPAGSVSRDIEAGEVVWAFFKSHPRM